VDLLSIRLMFVAWVPWTARTSFASLPDMYPRAWACLTALADTIGPGGRSAYRAPDGPAPRLPERGELVDARPRPVTSACHF
jgi:hypothetical protein